MVEQKTDLNNPKANAVRAHSNFADGLKYGFAATYRFGEIAPHFVTDVTPDEDHRFGNSHRLRTYTLRNPLMQGLYMHKDYYFVPTPAVLPLNYEKFMAVPNHGTDVVPYQVGTTVPGFFGQLAQVAAAARTFATTTPTWEKLFRYMVWRDMMLSDGCLLKYLGCSIPSYYSTQTVDAETDAFWSAVSQYIQNTSTMTVTFGSTTYYIDKRGANTGYGLISLHEAISRMRDDFSFTVTSGTIPSAITNLIPSGNPIDINDSAPVDHESLFAYQLVTAHWYSNDKIDAIYTAELFRQALRTQTAAIIGTGATGVDATFTYNGINCYYDTCSAYMVTAVLSAMLGTSPAPDEQMWIDFFDWCFLVYGFRRSLRFGDYFTASRTNPIAPGNVSVQVNNNAISVVESIQTSWYARLFSNVARLGHKLANQIKGELPGVNTVQDWHEPLWLANTQFDVFAEEIDNTGSAQMTDALSTTCVLRSNGEKVAFDMSVPDKYGTIIGVTYFDINRFYARAIERRFFHVDRFDKFQPYLQFNGDQKVYQKEINCNVNGISNAFGYQGAYMEYKQRYSQCAGGFSNGTLPGMIFIADVGRDRNKDVVNQSSDYIRSYPSELDGFYVSLTGFSLGTYFHFIVINDNFDDASKPMVYNPQLD